MRDNEKNMALLIEWCNEKCEGCRVRCDDCSVDAVKQLLVYAHNQQAEIERLKPFEKKVLEPMIVNLRENLELEKENSNLKEIIETMTNDQIRFGFEAKNKIKQASKHVCLFEKDFSKTFSKEKGQKKYAFSVKGKTHFFCLFMLCFIIF